MRHAKRRKLTVEDFNRALRWSNVEVYTFMCCVYTVYVCITPINPPMNLHKPICGYGSQDALPFRSVKEGELFFTEEREVNLVELALATNIPKGCAETMVRGTLFPCD